MSQLTAAQRNFIRNFLREQGITFDPLLEEMLDHVSSDIETRMHQGLTFDEAWRQTRKEIPENHLQTIQFETMETIEKRFTISRTLSFLALALLFAGTTFKIFHYQGAGELLLLSFVAMAGAFIASTVSGIYVYKEKKGAARVLSIVAATLLLMIGYSFKLLHLPGADTIVILGVGVCIASLLFNTLYIYRNTTGEANLLTYLHEKYTPGIERFFLFVLVPTAILRIMTLPTPPTAFVGTMLLIIVIFGTGLQFFALTWRALEKDPAKRNRVVLIAMVLSFTAFNLVFLGPLLGIEVRLILIMVFSVVTAWITYRIDAPKNYFIRFVLVLIPILFTGHALLGLHVIPESSARIVFNVIVLFMLTAAVFLSEKHEATRTFLILSMASYLLEYQGSLS